MQEDQNALLKDKTTSNHDGTRAIRAADERGEWEPDGEVDAIEVALRALAKLPMEGRVRAMDYLTARLIASVDA